MRAGRWIDTHRFTVYALLDCHSPGESRDDLPWCNTSHFGVLYIGENQLDFTAPHYRSEQFTVKPSTDDTGSDPATEASGRRGRKGL